MTKVTDPFVKDVLFYYLLVASTPMPAARVPPQISREGGKRAIATPQATTPTDVPGFSLTAATALSVVDTASLSAAKLQVGAIIINVRSTRVVNVRMLILH
jgi:hypothetical protein